jgi:hypothetical protein
LRIQELRFSVDTGLIQSSIYYVGRGVDAVGFKPSRALVETAIMERGSRVEVE